MIWHVNIFFLSRSRELVEDTYLVDVSKWDLELQYESLVEGVFLPW